MVRDERLEPRKRIELKEPAWRERRRPVGGGGPALINLVDLTGNEHDKVIVQPVTSLEKLSLE